MSFAHGAQDGLKFIGIMCIYSNIVTKGNFFEGEFLIMLICALTMGLGVFIGGKSIVTTVGEKIVKLDNNDALCSDISTILTLIVASFYGMPVSTTHVKTIAVASGSEKGRNLDKKKFKEIVYTWSITFPICGILAFLLMNIAILIIN